MFSSIEISLRINKTSFLVFTLLASSVKNCNLDDKHGSATCIKAGFVFLNPFGFSQSKPIG